MKTLFQKVPRFVLILVALTAFGLARGPFEDRLAGDLADANLLLPPPAQDAMQQMGQSALMGTLGGLRTLVSSFLTLKAFDHFSYKQWEELRQTYAIVCNLEPRDENHWRDVVWHIGINATADMQNNTSLPEFERNRRFNQYALQAVELAEQGLEHLPESVIIRMQLAEVYREKLRDNGETARVYGEVMNLPGAPPFARRFHGYFLARTPGKEQEAYGYLMGLYREGEHQHLPTLIKEIKNLEEKLAVPGPQRIPDRDPDRPASRPPRSSGSTLPGGIVVP